MARCKSKRIGKKFSFIFMCLGILTFLTYPIVIIIFNKGKLPTSHWWAISVIISKVLCTFLIAGFSWIVSTGKERKRQMEFKEKIIDSSIEKIGDVASEVKSLLIDKQGNVSISTNPTINPTIRPQG